MGWERVIVNNSCPKGLVEDLNEMKVIKAGIEKTKNAFPNIADMVRQRSLPPQLPSPPKDRSGVRVGIPKVLNMWSTHQFWVGFLREIGIASENIVFSSDTSEEQGREFGKGRGTVDCCYPVKAMSGHYGELIFGQKKKLNVILSPMIYSLPSFMRGHVRRNAGLHARDGRAGKYPRRIHEGKRRLRATTASSTPRRS